MDSSQNNQKPNIDSNNNNNNNININNNNNNNNISSIRNERISSPHVPPPNFFTNHPVDTFDDEEDDEDDLRQSLNSSIQMGNFRNSDNKYLSDSPILLSKSQQYHNQFLQQQPPLPNPTNRSNKPIDLNKESTFLPHRGNQSSTPTHSSKSLPSQHLPQPQEYVSLDMGSGQNQQQSTPTILHQQQQKQKHQQQQHSRNQRSTTKNYNSRIREIEDDEEEEMNIESGVDKTGQQLEQLNNPQLQSTKKKNFFSPLSTMFGFNKKKERPRISPDTINKNQRTPAYSSTRKYSIPQSSSTIFGGSSSTQQAAASAIPNHRHYLNNSLASPFSPFERMSPVRSPAPSPMAHHQLKRHMMKSSSESSIHKSYKTPSHHPSGYYFNDNHTFISNHSIEILQKIFHYPWMLLKFIITPKAGLIYPSKVIKRRSKVLSLLCLLMIVTYDSIGEMLRGILVTLVLLLFYSILSSIDLREIERKEERNQSLFKISNEALVVHKGGFITDANAAFESMFQIKLQDMLYPVPSGIWEFLPDLESIYSQDGSMDTPLPPVIETTAIDSGGRAFDVEVRTNKATYAGKPVDVFSIIDITGRKNLIEADVALRKAEAANEAKVVFLTTISHELKTPINGIMASCEILERSNLDAGQREFLDAIRMSSNYLYSLVLDILDYSKMEAGKMELVLDDFSLLKMLEDTLSMVSKNAQPKGLDLVGFVDSNVPVLVHGDATRVRQILLNLISNAIKFTDEGQIKIRVKLDREITETKEYQLLFEVEDSGIGIKNEHIVLLFTPFSQIDSSNSRKYQGTGLGLSISKRLANMMDGEVFVNSDFGIGSTFSFTIRLGYPVSKPGFTFQKMGGAIFMGDELEGFDSLLVGPRKVGKSGGPVVGVIVDPNQWVRKSIAQYFSLMSISCMEFEGEDDCREYFENNQSGNAACLIISSIVTLNSQTIKSGSRELHWVMLTFSPTPQLLPGFEDLIQKPCKFTDIVRCLFVVNRSTLDFFNESQIKKHNFPVQAPAPIPAPVSEPEQAASVDSLEASPTFNTPIGLTRSGRRPSVSQQQPKDGMQQSHENQSDINVPTTAAAAVAAATLIGTSMAVPAATSTAPTTEYIHTPTTTSPYDKDHTKKISTENVRKSEVLTEHEQEEVIIKPPPLPPVVPVVPAPIVGSSGGLGGSNNNNNNKHDELILLVEDNDINVKVFSRFLKIGNYNFKSALNGVEAVEMCQKYDFDLILMDCQMPRMDGFQATKAIRELEGLGKIKPPPMKRSPKLIIIALTANNEDRQKCLNVGMDDFLPKPASCALVLEAIKRHLEPEDDDEPLLIEHYPTTTTTTTSSSASGVDDTKPPSSSTSDLNK
ncbi:histidine kinase [Heterostelium album PN500]|uniref:Histidine kinase n=1 Tax=Heterostelium pallidum (strain ATCC 26659 / Pp 5 / PN500) TaxID=670386 RepID=D3BAX6_HETP5|nr:histidine kinase [Heterostelium album PN500]EFA81713.1 histidine kinase [Heterostelium album PN500]|eukprot:XP_020433830.1 histidine kinase [Heterostelium album PN500]